MEIWFDKFLTETEFFKAPDGNLYVTVSVNNHKENWPFKPDKVKKWLRNGFLKKGDTLPPEREIQDLFNKLEAKGYFNSPVLPVYTRIGEADGKVYLDLANEKWQVIEISGSGWKEVTDSPIKFRRCAGMIPLPNPVHGGSLEDLHKSVNLPTEKDRILYTSWLIGSLHPKGPYPILFIQGPQGSGKSFLCKLTRSIVDPSVAPLRAIPKDDWSLMISATNSWVICFDNLTGTLPGWLADDLCRISTGGGLAVRKHYEDAEENLFNVRRPVILNSIDSIVTRHDLADRSIILNIPPISGTTRKSEIEIQAKFNISLPGILGALMDAASMAIKNLPSTKLSSLPRMADFAIWVSAAEPSLPWQNGDFMKAYAGNREEIVEKSLENNSLAYAIRALVEDYVEWAGNATELLETLGNYVSAKVKKSKFWPKKPNALSGRINKLRPFLEEVGIEVDLGREGHGGPKYIRIAKIHKDAEDIR